MEPVLLFIEGWWWIAPAAAGAGAAGYTAMTTNRRRARRLELDAARHEERLAYRELQAAKAEVSAAKGALLAMKASPYASLPALVEARRRFARAREAERSSSLALRGEPQLAEGDRPPLSLDAPRCAASRRRARGPPRRDHRTVARV